MISNGLLPTLSIILIAIIVNKTVVKLKNQGLVQQGRYDHDVVGYNYRMTNVQAAIGVAQLAEVKKILNLKRQIADRYRSDLKGLVEFQVCDTQYCSNWINTVKFGSITKKKWLKKHCRVIILKFDLVFHE